MFGLAEAILRKLAFVEVEEMLLLHIVSLPCQPFVPAPRKSVATPMKDSIPLNVTRCRE